MAFALATLLGLLQLQTVGAVTCLDIDTTSGPVKGFINETTPHVAQFLGIPFAEPPVGARRWLLAVPKAREERVINATHFGPSCPQWATDVNVEANVYPNGFPNFTPSPLDYLSEDCLSLNIWAPYQREKSGSRDKKRLPVILWLYGGGYTTGGGNVPYQNPEPWVQKSGKHIVVSLNYRLNVFGFPNAKGLKLEEQNLGMLDMRLAVEWTRKNIVNFGGDPKRISLMGQSSGAIAADHYNFAHPKDPIVSSFILHSGTATLNFLSPDPGQSNFTFLAQQFGCARSDPVVELECFRKVNASSISTFLKYYSQNATTPPLTFVPILDNHTLFKNYTARALAGNFSRKPALIGNTANEGAYFVLPLNATYGPGQDRADQTTVGLFMCPTIQTSHDRFAAKATTFRYLYAGNFSTISPRWWEGAYHSSDLPMIFGTYALARGPGTEFQKKTSEKMQELWVAFAEDPADGLPKLGWKSYKNGAGEGIMFGTDGKASQLIAESRLDQPCDGLVPNGKPPPPR